MKDSNYGNILDMENQPKFVIKGTSDPEKLNETAREIESLHTKGAEKIDKEIEKSPENIEKLELLDKALGEAVTEMGLEYTSIKPERIHFLSEEDFLEYSKNFDFTDTTGEEDNKCIAGLAHFAHQSMVIKDMDEFDPIGDNTDSLESLQDTLADSAISIWQENNPDDDLNSKECDDFIDEYINSRLPNYEEVESFAERIKSMHTPLHEMLHCASYQSFQMGDKKLTVRRAGYDGSHLLALNEAVTEKLTLEIMWSNRHLLAGEHKNVLEQLEKLQSEFGENELDFVSNVLDLSLKDGSYEEFRIILKLVMEGIAERDSSTPEEVWARFKRGYFSGEMMHLRDIEQAFGKGALRVFANTTAKNVKTIKKYFQSTDEAEKDKLAEKILAKEPEEKEKWQKRKDNKKGSGL